MVLREVIIRVPVEKIGMNIHLEIRRLLIF